MGLKKRKKSGAMVRKKKKSKKRIVPKPKQGGFLPLKLPILGALVVLGWGVAGIAKAVNDVKAQQIEREEQKRCISCRRGSRIGEEYISKAI